MAITLAQLAQAEVEPLRKAIILNIIREAKIMEIVPFENISSLRTIAVRVAKLPTGNAWRKLNEGYTNDEQGQLEQVEESLFGFGGEILYDRVISKLTNFIKDPITIQTELKIKSLAYDWKNIFINGDHASDEDSFEGLKKRVANLPSRQTVLFDGTGSAAPLDATADAAHARKFFNKLDVAWKRCNDGQVNAILANEETQLGLTRAVRLMQSAGNFLDTTRDSLEREILTWRGAPVIDMGTLKDMSTEIILNTEVADDAGADSTSMYFVSFNTEQGITGIQLESLNVYDPLSGGEMEGTPQKMRRIDWWNGLAMFGSYGVVRARNLAAAAGWTE